MEKTELLPLKDKVIAELRKEFGWNSDEAFEMWLEQIGLKEAVCEFSSDAMRAMWEELVKAKILLNTRTPVPDVGKLKELIRHAWVHSGYTNCGYSQMTMEQKILYVSITNEEETASVLSLPLDVEARVKEGK
jgi:hypothetical protein